VAVWRFTRVEVVPSTADEVMETRESAKAIEEVVRLP